MRFQVLAGRTETEPSRRHLSMCVCGIAHADGGTRATPGPAHSRPDPRRHDPTCVCVLKLLGPVAPALSALVTPRGYTVRREKNRSK